MTSMAGLDCEVMSNLINTHTHTRVRTHTRIHTCTHIRTAAVETVTAKGVEPGTGTRMETEGRKGGRELWKPPHQERSRVEDQTLSFRTRYPLCEQEVVPTVGQQLRAQDPVPIRRCSTEERSGPRGREGENGGGNRDECGHKNRDEDGDGHKDRNGKGGGNGFGNENGEKDRGK